MPQPRLLLIDGSHYLYRAFHACPALLSPQQEPVGALLGVLNMVRRLIRQTVPDGILVAFDERVATYRKALYPDYKIQRARMPQALETQILPIRMALGYMGLRIYFHPGEEADDIIGTMALRGAREHYEVLIASGDKDLAQLVGETNPSLVDLENGALYHRQQIFEKYGVYPEQITDYLALRGDTSDNVPGVSGIGEKTAIALIRHFGTIENLYQNLSIVPNIGLRGGVRIQGLLEQQKESAYLSKHLVTLRCDLAIPLAGSQLHLDAPDWESLASFFRHYRFQQWSHRVETKDLFGWHHEETKAAAVVLPSDGQQRSNCTKNRLQATRLMGLTALDQALEVHGDQPIGLMMQCIEKNNRQSLIEEQVLDHWNLALCVGDQIFIDEGDATHFSGEWVVELKAKLHSDPRPLVLFDLKTQLHCFAHFNDLLGEGTFDVKLAAYLLDTRGPNDLSSLCARYLPEHRVECMLPVDWTDPSPSTVELLEAVVQITQLHKVLRPALQAIPALSSLLDNVDMPLAKILYRMEKRGILVDWTGLLQQRAAHTIALQSLKASLYSQAGETFNLNSSQQLQRILFEKLGLPATKKTGKGALSTREEVLVPLAEKSEFARDFLIYREIQKLMGTYIDGLEKRRCQQCERLHTRYHAAMTRTGRLSSTNPNLQNIPIRSERGRAIRRLFVPQPGYCLLVADYDQIELKIMAHLSSDAALLDAFQHNQDVHRLAAAEIYQLPPEAVTIAQRRAAKAVTFGLMYGMSPFGLAKHLKAGRQEAQVYLERYFQKYAGIKQYIQALQLQLEHTPYVETLLGRRLYFSAFDTKGANRQAQLRAAINAPMQGSAADIMRLGMLAVEHWVQTLPDPQAVRLLLQVHDELVFEIHQNWLTLAQQEIKKALEGVIALKVPLTVTIGTGSSWEAAH